MVFTPLAQKELLQLMKDNKKGFGDDFDFVKNKKLNYIYPEHLQHINLDAAPDYFRGYDFDDVKNRFFTYNIEFFRHLYFAFAPILAIPLYRQHRPGNFTYMDSYDSIASCYWHEYIVNSMPREKFVHPQAATPSILKTSVISSNGKKDTVRVTASSYRTEECVDYVTRLGGDGKLHTIPVYWINYIPVEKITDVIIDIPGTAD